MPRGIKAGFKKIQWVNVVSSNIKRIAHSGAPLNTLFVEFKSGDIAQYAAVPRDVYYRMTRAASKGKFLHRVVKPSYAFIGYM